VLQCPNMKIELECWQLTFQFPTYSVAHSGHTSCKEETLWVRDAIFWRQHCVYTYIVLPSENCVSCSEVSFVYSEVAFSAQNWRARVSAIDVLCPRLPSIWAKLFPVVGCVHDRRNGRPNLFSRKYMQFVFWPRWKISQMKKFSKLAQFGIKLMLQRSVHTLEIFNVV